MLWIRKTSLAFLLGLSLLLPAPLFAQNTPPAPKEAKKELTEKEIIQKAKEIEAQVIQIIQKVRPSVVVIRVERTVRGFNTSRKAYGGGSGVIFDKEGYILTNHHVIDRAGKVWVGLPGKKLVVAKLLGIDKIGDLAVLKIEGKNFPAVEFGDSENLQVGQWVMAMGNPFSLAEDNYPTITRGIISGLNRVQGGIKLYGDAIQTDASINPGNSGGPLFDMEGKLIGINGRISIRAGQRVNVGVGYAIPIHQIKNFLPLLKSGKTVDHAFLGIRFSRELKGTTRGVMIEEIVSGSSAYKAGLRKGDVILKFRGKPITSYSKLQNIISVLPADTEVSFAALRNGKILNFKVKLGKRPAAEE